MSEKMWPQDGGHFLFSCSCPCDGKYFLSFAWPRLHYRVPSRCLSFCDEPLNQCIQQIVIVYRLPGAERCARNWGPEVLSVFVQIKMPMPLNLVTEADGRDFHPRHWSVAPALLSIQLLGR